MKDESMWYIVGNSYPGCLLVISWLYPLFPIVSAIEFSFQFTLIICNTVNSNICFPYTIITNEFLLCIRDSEIEGGISSEMFWEVINDSQG
jgi:hypothetical protein